jgi:hypothetical protein
LLRAQEQAGLSEKKIAGNSSLYPDAVTAPAVGGDCAAVSETAESG